MSYFKKLLNNKLIIILLFFILSLSIISSIITIYQNQNIFKNFLIKTQSEQNKKDEEDKIRLIINNIIKGKYILFFRHTHRERWQDVQTYDSLENNKMLQGESQEFKNAVCLSDKGKIHAKTIGIIMRDTNIPFSEVISSSSCRARQTAKFMFGKIDKINKNFMHYGTFNEKKVDYEKKLKKELKLLKMSKNKNIFISGHNSTITPNIFDVIKIADSDYSLDEGGFFVIEKKNDQLILVHKFINFQAFNKLNVKRKIYKKIINNQN